MAGWRGGGSTRKRRSYGSSSCQRSHAAVGHDVWCSHVTTRCTWNTHRFVATIIVGVIALLAVLVAVVEVAVPTRSNRSIGITCIRGGMVGLMLCFSSLLSTWQTFVLG
jgi:hypothetical protein